MKNSNLAYLMEFTLARIEKLLRERSLKVLYEKNSILAYLLLEFTLARIEKWRSSQEVYTWAFLKGVPK